MKFGVLFRPVSLWIGGHYSPVNKRLCVNIVPFITFWIAAEDGQVPKQGFDIYRNDLDKHPMFEIGDTFFNGDIEYRFINRAPKGLPLLDYIEDVRVVVKAPFWDRDLDDIESDFLPPGKKITDMPIRNSVDGMPT